MCQGKAKSCPFILSLCHSYQWYESQFCFLIGQETPNSAASLYAPSNTAAHFMFLCIFSFADTQTAFFSPLPPIPKSGPWLEVQSLYHMDMFSVSPGLHLTNNSHMIVIGWPKDGRNMQTPILFCIKELPFLRTNWELTVLLYACVPLHVPLVLCGFPSVTPVSWSCVRLGDHVPLNTLPSLPGYSPSRTARTLYCRWMDGLGQRILRPPEDCLISKNREPQPHMTSAGAELTQMCSSLKCTMPYTDLFIFLFLRKNDKPVPGNVSWVGGRGFPTITFAKQITHDTFSQPI